MDNDNNVANNNKKGVNKAVLVAGVVVIGLVGLFIAKNNAQKEKNEDAAQVTQTVKSEPTTQPSDRTDEVSGETVQASPTTSSQEKVFTVKGSNFSFSPNKITVNKGDKVKIVFQDDDGFHDLVIGGYNVNTERIKTGGASQVEFVADKTGVFEYFCSVADHREEGMKGTLTVL